MLHSPFWVHKSIHSKTGMSGKVVTRKSGENRICLNAGMQNWSWCLKWDQSMHLTSFQAALLFLAHTFNRTIQNTKLAIHLHIIMKENCTNKVWWKHGCLELLGSDTKKWLLSLFLAGSLSALPQCLIFWSSFLQLLCPTLGVWSSQPVVSPNMSSCRTRRHCWEIGGSWFMWIVLVKNCWQCESCQNKPLI